ncbi:PAP2 superfamily protein [Bacillus sp. 491mf]|uniref:vanadium-dependent haloperoxidase n=1 Tax=unclassified Bacillus (in: firmicutes) TaxID=185979 RepID=UPI0008E278D6|nr:MULTISPECIES: vanadium-dependent haloperoxidase [unclassified Bacillus (in: firmicutes)]SFC27454.1 PAP2 superfamily protein [Bacillus sp. 491mf]
MKHIWNQENHLRYPFPHKANSVKGCEIGPISAEKRSDEALDIRLAAAFYQKSLPIPKQLCNGDEERFLNKIANYSKALPHNNLGEVDLCAYQKLIEALKSGKPSAFESLILGGTVKLTNPQSAYAYELEGPDSHHLSIAAPPAFSSAWEASEMAELYWQALLRDVPFTEYDTSPLANAAASDLSSFSDFRGPKAGGVVTTGTLFRGGIPGSLIGPYISQFMWKDVPFGATAVVQKYRTALPNKDYMTSYKEWLDIQNGSPAQKMVFDTTSRYIRNGRDLGEYVHQDFPYQACLSACLILIGFGEAALSTSNPYLHSKTQKGFATFGAPHILDLVGRTTKVALEAAWFQKFLVHRRLRPEEFGGRVQNQLTGAAKYPINSELLNSQAVSQVFSRFGTYLLPMAYSEGCPTHPAYPSGHASFVGAGVTVLKAFFNESFIIPQPVVADTNGLSLLPYFGQSLTVGDELNKLACNIGIGRDMAGVHWRTDISEGMKLGEAVAIGVLHDYKKTYNENFSGFTFTKFDGTTITI